MGREGRFGKFKAGRGLPLPWLAWKMRGRPGTEERGWPLGPRTDPWGASVLQPQGPEFS